MKGLEFFDILVEFLFFLLHTVVVHFVEVALLAELVPCVLGLFSHDASLVQFGTEMVDLLLELLVTDVNIGNIG